MKRIFFVLLGLLLIVALKAQVVYPVKYFANNVVIRGYLVVEGPTTMPYLIVEDSLKINGQAVKWVGGDSIPDLPWVRAYVAAHGGGSGGGEIYASQGVYKDGDTLKLTVDWLNPDASTYREIGQINESTSAYSSIDFDPASAPRIHFNATGVTGGSEMSSSYDSSGFSIDPAINPSNWTDNHLVTKGWVRDLLPFTESNFDMTDSETNNYFRFNIDPNQSAEVSYSWTNNSDSYQENTEFSLSSNQFYWWQSQMNEDNSKSSESYIDFGNDLGGGYLDLFSADTTGNIYYGLTMNTSFISLYMQETEDEGNMEFILNNYDNEWRISILGEQVISQDTSTLRLNRGIQISNSFVETAADSGTVRYRNKNLELFNGDDWNIVGEPPFAMLTDPNYVETVKGDTSILSNSTGVSSFCLSEDGKYITTTMGNPAILLYSKDGGVTWNDSDSPLGSWTTMSASYDGAYQVAADYPGTGGYIYYSADTGATWTQSNSILGDWIDVAISADGSYAAAAEYKSGIYISTDQGANWTLSLEGLGISADMSADGTYMLAILSDSLLVSSDHGQNWNLVYTGATGGSYCSVSASGQYMAITGPAIFSSDYGLSWTRKPDGITYTDLLSMSAGGSPMVGLHEGKIIYSLDYGKTIYYYHPDMPKYQIANAKITPDGSAIFLAVNNSPYEFKWIPNPFRINLQVPVQMSKWKSYDSDSANIATQGWVEEYVAAHGGTGTGGVMDSSWNSIDIGIGNNHTSINSDGTIHQYNNGVEMFKTTINGYIGMDYINENSVLGPMALSLNSTGIRNSAVGTGSLYSNSSGNYNSGYGLQTLFNNTSGSQLIGLGARAGKYSTTLSNRLFINSLDRNNLQGDSTLSIIYGHQAFAAENQRLVVNAKLINNGAFNYGSDAGSNDAYAISIPGITVYVTGMQVTFKTNTANTGACTININSLGAKSLKIKHDQDPGDNYIESGSIVMAVYDGTYFQMIQPAAN